MRTETGRTDCPNESRNCRPAVAAPSPGMNHIKKKRGVPDAMSGTPLRSVCGILCGQQKSAKSYSFKKLQKAKENTRNPKISGVVLELLTRFELVTSSLPILPRLFFPTLLCFVLKPETLAAQGFQAFLFCIFIFPVLRSRMGFLMPVWVLYGFCSVQSAAIF